MTSNSHQEELCNKLIAMFTKLFGAHPGFRPLHAKGIMCAGTFTPSAEARKLTRAPHASGDDVKVSVRYSNSTGVPVIPDTDPNSRPHGIGVRFHLGEHVHTDIVAHTFNSFPTRTGEEFLQMLEAVSATTPDSPKPTPVETFMSSHPAAHRFVSTPKPMPTSFVNDTYFAVTAFKFINAQGQEQFGRFEIQPEKGNQYLIEGEVASKFPNFLYEELEERLKNGSAKLRVFVELAEPGDVVDDSTIPFPAGRKRLEFGTITLTNIIADDDVDAKRVIFDPIPRVDGIEPSADPLIDLRAAIYLMTGRRRRAELAAKQ